MEQEEDIGVKTRKDDNQKWPFSMNIPGKYISKFKKMDEKIESQTKSITIHHRESVEDMKSRHMKEIEEIRACHANEAVQNIAKKHHHTLRYDANGIKKQYDDDILNMKNMQKKEMNEAIEKKRTKKDIDDIDKRNRKAIDDRTSQFTKDMDELEKGFTKTLNEHLENRRKKEIETIKMKHKKTMADAIEKKLKKKELIDIEKMHTKELENVEMRHKKEIEENDKFHISIEKRHKKEIDDMTTIHKKEMVEEMEKKRMKKSFDEDIEKRHKNAMDDTCTRHKKEMEEEMNIKIEEYQDMEKRHVKEINNVEMRHKKEVCDETERNLNYDYHKKNLVDTHRKSMNEINRKYDVDIGNTEIRHIDEQAKNIEAFRQKKNNYEKDIDKRHIKELKEIDDTYNQTIKSMSKQHKKDLEKTKRKHYYGWESDDGYSNRRAWKDVTEETNRQRNYMNTLIHLKNMGWNTSGFHHRHRNYGGHHENHYGGYGNHSKSHLRSLMYPSYFGDRYERIESVSKIKPEQLSQIQRIQKISTEYYSKMGILKENESIILKIKDVTEELKVLKNEAKNIASEIDGSNIDLENGGIELLDKLIEKLSSNSVNKTDKSEFAFRIQTFYENLNEFLNIHRNIFSKKLKIENKDDNKKMFMYNVQIFLNMLSLIFYENGEGMSTYDLEVIDNVSDLIDPNFAFSVSATKIKLYIKDENNAEQRKRLYDLVAADYFTFVKNTLPFVNDTLDNPDITKIINKYSN